MKLNILHMILVLEIERTFINGYLIIPLLRVDSGVGISFIDLWNLSRTSTGTSTDRIYRNGILDNVFRERCPSKLQLYLMKSGIWGYYLIYRGNYTENSLSWLTTTPIDAMYSVNVTVHLKPRKDILLEVSDFADSSKLYVEVYHPNNTVHYPQYYYVNDNNPQPGPIPGNENKFHSADYLEIRALYDDLLCDLTDHNIPMPISTVIAILQGVDGTVTTNFEETETIVPISIVYSTVESSNGKGTVTRKATEADVSDITVLAELQSNVTPAITVGKTEASLFPNTVDTLQYSNKDATTIITEEAQVILPSSTEMTGIITIKEQEIVTPASQLQTIDITPSGEVLGIESDKTFSTKPNQPDISNAISTATRETKTIMSASDLVVELESSGATVKPKSIGTTSSVNAFISQQESISETKIGKKDNEITTIVTEETQFILPSNTEMTTIMTINEQEIVTHASQLQTINVTSSGEVLGIESDKTFSTKQNQLQISNVISTAPGETTTIMSASDVVVELENSGATVKPKSIGTTNSVNTYVDQQDSIGETKIVTKDNEIIRSLNIIQASGQRTAETIKLTAKDSQTTIPTSSFVSQEQSKGEQIVASAGPEIITSLGTAETSLQSSGEVITFTTKHTATTHLSTFGTEQGSMGEMTAITNTENTLPLSTTNIPYRTSSDVIAFTNKHIYFTTPLTAVVTTQQTMGELTSENKTETFSSFSSSSILVKQESSSSETFSFTKASGFVTMATQLQTASEIEMAATENGYRIHNNTEMTHLNNSIETATTMEQIIDTYDRPVCSSNDESSLYYRLSSNRYPSKVSSDAAWVVKTKNFFTCAMMCMNDIQQCVSFYYIDSGMCTGLKHLESAADKPTDAKHYIIDRCL